MRNDAIPVAVLRPLPLNPRRQERGLEEEEKEEEEEEEEEKKRKRNFQLRTFF